MISSSVPSHLPRTEIRATKIPGTLFVEEILQFRRRTLEGNVPHESYLYLNDF